MFIVVVLISWGYKLFIIQHVHSWLAYYSKGEINFLLIYFFGIYMHKKSCFTPSGFEQLPCLPRYNLIWHLATQKNFSFKESNFIKKFCVPLNLNLNIHPNLTCWGSIFEHFTKNQIAMKQWASQMPGLHFFNIRVKPPFWHKK